MSADADIVGQPWPGGKCRRHFANAVLLKEFRPLEGKAVISKAAHFLIVFKNAVEPFPTRACAIMPIDNAPIEIDPVDCADFRYDFTILIMAKMFEHVSPHSKLKAIRITLSRNNAKNDFAGACGRIFRPLKYMVSIRPSKAMKLPIEKGAKSP